MVLHQWKGLSGSALKIIALVSMTMDHIAYYLMEHGSLMYDLMRTMGRMAFPIFAFLLVEGYVHTRSTGKYALNLLAFALISEAPWWLLNHDNTHNVFFTLLLGLVAIDLITRIGNKPLLWCVIMASICANATWLHVDYEYSGILLICSWALAGAGRHPVLQWRARIYKRAVCEIFMLRILSVTSLSPHIKIF